MSGAASGVQAWLGRYGLRPGLQLGSRTGTGVRLEAGRFVRADQRSWAELELAASHRRYTRAAVRVGTRLSRSPRAGSIEIVGAVARQTREEFWGLGNASAVITDYQLRTQRIGVTMATPLGAGLTLSGTLDWIRAETSPGTNEALPDLPDWYSAAGAPGYGRVARSAAVTVGLRAERGQPFSQARRGAWLEGSYRRVILTSNWMEPFGRLRAYAGVERPVLGARAGVTLAALFDGILERDRPVPFYDLPVLGGATLAALPWDRYRDRQMAAARFEARCRVVSAGAGRLWVDAILFSGHGLVGNPIALDAGWRALHHSYGAAVGFVSPAGALGRVGLATGGGEGLRPVLTFSTTF